MSVQGLKTVSGECLSTLGAAPIAIQIRSFIYEHEAAVIPQFEYEAVLGLDFLVASEVKLDLQRGSMSLTFTNPNLDRNISQVDVPACNLFNELAFHSIQLQPEFKSLKVYLIESAEIGPWADHIIQLYVPEPTNVQEIGIVEASDQLFEKYELQGDTILVNVPANRIIPFRVRNASNQTIHFHPGTAPGKF